MRSLSAYQIDIMFTLSLALGGYALAEGLHVSAPLEAVAAGLALRQFNRNHPPGAIAHESMDRFWTVVDQVQNSILFVLLGVEVLGIPFPRRAFASGALAIVTVAAVRMAVVALVVMLVRAIEKKMESSILTLGWGGLRGGLSIALALSVPDGRHHSWIVATTYIVVVFSIVIQGGTLDIFLRRGGAGPCAPAS